MARMNRRNDGIKKGGKEDRNEKKGREKSGRKE